MARIEEDKLCLDVRTLEGEEFRLVCAALRQALQRASTDWPENE